MVDELMLESIDPNQNSMKRMVGGWELLLQF